MSRHDGEHESKPPVDLLREQSADDGAKTAGKRPDTANDAKVGSAFAHGEEIRDGNIDENDKTASTDSLDDSSRNHWQGQCLFIDDGHVECDKAVQLVTANIHMFMLMARPAIRDPTKKMALVMSRHGLRPKISETLPQMGVAAEFAMRYAEPTHV